MARQQEELKDRLDAFVRKYHRNEMLRGGLILAACVPVAWLVVLGLEAMGRFGMTARTALFYLFVTVVSAVAIRYLLLPAMRNLSAAQATSPWMSSPRLAFAPWLSQDEDATSHDQTAAA